MFLYNGTALVEGNLAKPAKLNIYFPFDPAVPFLGISTRDTLGYKLIYTSIFIIKTLYYKKDVNSILHQEGG